MNMGWEMPEVWGIHQQIEATTEVVKVYDWGVVDKLGLIWYRRVSVEVNARRVLECGKEKATVYTDGSGTTKDKPAGIGVYVIDGPHRVFVSENIGNGTNNRAELCAIWRALRQFPWLHKPILVRSDSEYAIGSMTQDWHPNVNADLIRRMREDLAERNFKVEFEHVPGHSKIEGNEIADRLSGVGRKLVTLVTDYGS